MNNTLQYKHLMLNLFTKSGFLCLAFLLALSAPVYAGENVGENEPYLPTAIIAGSVISCVAPIDQYKRNCLVGTTIGAATTYFVKEGRPYIGAAAACASALVMETLDGGTSPSLTGFTWGCIPGILTSVGVSGLITFYSHQNQAIAESKPIPMIGLNIDF